MDDKIYALSPPNEEKLEKTNKFLKSIYAYENWNKQYGEHCHNGHCAYAILNLKNNEYIYFSCGRQKLTIKLYEKGKVNKNGSKII